MSTEHKLIIIYSYHSTNYSPYHLILKQKSSFYNKLLTFLTYCLFVYFLAQS